MLMIENDIYYSTKVKTVLLLEILAVSEITCTVPVMVPSYICTPIRIWLIYNIPMIGLRRLTESFSGKVFYKSWKNHPYHHKLSGYKMHQLRETKNQDRKDTISRRKFDNRHNYEQSLSQFLIPIMHI